MTVLLSHPLGKGLSSSFAVNLSVFLANISLLVLLARITLRLPFTPVPITGQTFGILLISFLSGRTRAATAVSAYLAAGFIGFPVFAGGHAWLMGPTTGYLPGMFVGSLVVGTLSDRGWSRHFWGCVGAGYLGSFCIFTCGLAGLSFFVPLNRLLQQGYFPFIVGDGIKIVTAALCVTGFRKCGLR